MENHIKDRALAAGIRNCVQSPVAHGGAWKQHMRPGALEEAVMRGYHPYVIQILDCFERRRTQPPLRFPGAQHLESAGSWRRRRNHATCRDWLIR
ncbi:hypothetical protein DPEC_G00067910 [Dallia pectoralis]|uniref:Uncharacterized protein n=1 Tax=Dallia pectoralis TaxID=75939 RepID=A0ACC2H1B5_DALPE|nr:hypothetical protein DPEC_G00067910 [Dallia pectoralis]